MLLFSQEDLDKASELERAADEAFGRDSQAVRMMLAIGIASLCQAGGIEAVRTYLQKLLALPSFAQTLDPVGGAAAPPSSSPPPS